MDPDLIAQKLGVSLLVLKQGIKYKQQRIHIVILLTTPDKTSHLSILYTLNGLAKDSAFIKQLQQAKTSSEAYETVITYAKKIKE